MHHITFTLKVIFRYRGWSLLLSMLRIPSLTFFFFRFSWFKYEFYFDNNALWRIKWHCSCIIFNWVVFHRMIINILLWMMWYCIVSNGAISYWIAWDSEAIFQIMHRKIIDRKAWYNNTCRAYWYNVVLIGV